MSWKESEVVPEGNGPVHQREEFGSGQPTLEDVYQMMKEAFDRWDKMLNEISDEARESVTRLEHGARQSRLAMEADGQASQLSEEMKMDQHLARQEQDARQSRLAMEADGQASQLSEEMKMDRDEDGPTFGTPRARRWAITSRHGGRRTSKPAF